MMQIDLDYAAAHEIADIFSADAGFAFLDSSGDYAEQGRYSFIGLDPFGIFHVQDGKAFWNDTPLAGAPLAELGNLLRHFRHDNAPRGFPFTGGAIGFIAYDFGRRLEKLVEPADTESRGEEIFFGFYDLVLAFDHHDHRCVLFSSGLPETDPSARTAHATARAANVQERLAAAYRPAPQPAGAGHTGEWQSNFSQAGYEQAVRQVQEYILAGDIYQANISQRFSCSIPDDFDHWSFYRTLRTTNPAPFSAFMKTRNLVIASSSPERFLRCSSGQVEARPIKGTTRRLPDPSDDARAAKALQESEKDRAENTMIVDLLRNDLSRVCAPGTVEVPVLCGLETYAGLHHLTSVVTGRLRDGYDTADLLQATFPGGSITGAPKLRAMDIITEIEQLARGVYCGSMGYIGFDGNMDLNIAIRTVTFHRVEASFQAGGGITLLSDPEEEYLETLTKAQRIFDAFSIHAGTVPVRGTP